MKKVLFVLTLFLSIFPIFARSQTDAYLKNKNKTAGDDFYYYINKDWMIDALKSSPDFYLYGSYSNSSDVTTKQFINILDNLVPENEHEELLLRIYRAAFDKENRNINFKPVIQKYLDLITEAGSPDELLKIDTQLFNETGRTVLINLYKYFNVGAGYQLFFLGEPFSFNYKNKKQQKLADEYLSFLSSQFSLPLLTRANYKKLLDLKLMIAGIDSSPDGKETPYFTYIKNLYPELKIGDLFIERQLAPVGWLKVTNQNSIREKINLFYSADLTLLKLNMQLNLIVRISDFLSYDCEYEWWKFYAGINCIEPPNEEYIIKYDCLSYLKSYAYPLMEELYEKYYATEEIKQDIRNIFNDVQKNYSDLIEKSSLIKDSSKDRFKFYINRMRLSIGGELHPTSFFDYKEHVADSSYFDLICELFKASNRYYKKSNEMGYCFSEYSDNSYDYDAFMTSKGDMYLYWGFIYSNYNKDASYEYRLGSLGYAIGHELSHMFTDYFGSTNGTVETNFIKLYDNYPDMHGVKNHGHQTFGEGLSDIFGLQAALMAVQNNIENPDYKDFFTAYAVGERCVTTSGEEYWLSGDSHPLPRARINCCVVNFPEFYEAFDIKPGDKMYVKPEDRVTLF